MAPQLGIVAILVCTTLGFAFWSRHVAASRRELCVQLLEIVAAAARQGLPLPRLLASFAAEQRPRARRLIERTADQLGRGEALADALVATLPLHFPRDVLHALRSAQGSARFAGAVESLAVSCRRREAVHHQLGLAFFYPALLATISLLIVVVVAPLGFGFPRVDKAAYIVFAVLGAGFFSTMIMSLFPGVTRWRLMGWFGRGLRGFLPLAKWPAVAAILRNTAALVDSGIALPEALRRASPAPAGRRGRRLEAAARSLEEGQGLLQGLRDAGLPRGYAERIAATTSAAPEQLPASFRRLAVECDARLDRGVDRVARVLTPAALLVFGSVVCWQCAGFWGWYSAQIADLLPG